MTYLLLSRIRELIKLFILRSPSFYVVCMTKTNCPLLSRVQLISDELDEIKVRLDTLHEDLEQGAIDKIDNRINELLEQIRAKNVSSFVVCKVTGNR